MVMGVHQLVLLKLDTSEQEDLLLVQIHAIPSEEMVTQFLPMKHEMMETYLTKMVAQIYEL